VGCGYAGCRACGHVFGVGGWLSDQRGHGRVGFNECAVVKDHMSDGRAASVWAVLPAGIGEYGQVGVWYVVLAAYNLDGAGSGVWVEFEA
jgi:hypothetical protein